MRKLVILKSLVDFIWYVTCLPLIPLTLFFSVYMFFDPDILKIFNVLEEGVIITPWYLKVVTLLIVVLLSVFVYSFYLFRKTLRYFQQVKPFDEFVITSYKKIGNMLVVSGVLSAILSFLFHLLVKSQLQLQFGFTSNLFIICLGLFFLVLSELFKIAKVAKEENQLTI
ncbi:DUF2975 domain-containing protein [Bizionia gelidisalsuginis]|uniref:DUF2975 domain-containing protein n=2 Tax=Bizionia TaxID=283785 RepID=A0A8H2QFH4_9FLAO|nr:MULTISPECIES: DUF2975 domain-containing protein [Bizionia]TYB75986.1 DUF2975 domain-containing protein [Bizionia saleffrena]TYC13489.1 DUF2975 domain-containing protein [Bizionia gelidisalsuginis]